MKLGLYNIDKRCYYGGTMRFKIGDMVLYPSYGVGRVIDILPSKVFGEEGIEVYHIEFQHVKVKLYDTPRLEAYELKEGEVMPTAVPKPTGKTAKVSKPAAKAVTTKAPAKTTPKPAEPKEKKLTGGFAPTEAGWLRMHPATDLAAGRLTFNQIKALANGNKIVSRRAGKFIEINEDSLVAYLKTL